MGKNTGGEAQHTLSEKAAAWAVHIFTASGVLWGLLALSAIFDGRTIDAYLWMFIAVMVDAVDGFLARKFRVKAVVPQIDGALLDNVVDYLNWSFIPAIFLWRSGWLLEPGIFWAGCILMCSAFAFVHTDAKVIAHGYFRGFPSYWNIFAFLCDVTIRSLGSAMPDHISLVVTSLLVLFCILSVLPVYFVYPTRVVRWKPFFTWGSGIWTVQCGVMVLMYPDIPQWLFFSSLIFPSIYLLLGVLWTPRVHREIHSGTH